MSMIQRKKHGNTVFYAQRLENLGLHNHAATDDYAFLHSSR
jgi:hypothetical protein